MDQGELTGLICGRPKNFAWFLGAGASRSSGLKTATDVIWDLKRRYYNQQESQSVSEQDVQHPAVAQRIQSFVDARGFPALWADGEYSTYFEMIFGDDKERQRQYIRGVLAEDKVRLSVGNRVLGALMASGECRVVFTTNFDSVVEKAVADVSGASIAAHHLEGAHNAKRALDNEEYPLYVKLHGDFRYDSIKNLGTDLAAQNAELSECLLNAGNRFGVVVAGYSGRDQSVMELFRSILASPNPFPHGLYWTGIKGSPIPPVVETLIQDAKDKGIRAEYVEVTTFDSLMSRLWRNIDNKPAGLDAKVCRSVNAAVSIPLPAAGRAQPIVRLNALPITGLPGQCQAIALRRAIDWKELRSKQHSSNGGLIFTMADAVWCWGAETEIRSAFGGDLLSVSAQSLPIDYEAAGALHAKGFLEEGLCVALARGKPLLARKTRYEAWLIVDPHAQDISELSALHSVVGKTSGKAAGLMTVATAEHPQPQQVSWAEAVKISLDIRDGKPWLLLEPDIWVWPTRARRNVQSFLDDKRKDRYNKKLNALLDAWVPLLLGGDQGGVPVALTPFEAGSIVENPIFEIGGRTAFTRRFVA